VPRLVPHPEKAGVGKQNAVEGDSRWSSSFVMVARGDDGLGSSSLVLLEWCHGHDRSLEITAQMGR
jgi:hypothetical protein